VLEVAVTKTTPKREKQNADVGEALACVQAGAHVSAHAQHTNAPVQDAPVQDAPVQDAPVQDAPVQRTCWVMASVWDRRHVLHVSRGRMYTHEQFVRLIADKRAKGYVLCQIARYTSGSIDLAFQHKASPTINLTYQYIGRVHMADKAGRTPTEYAPIQEARE